MPHLRLDVASIASYTKGIVADVSVIDPQAENLSMDELVPIILSLRPDYFCLPAYTEEINDAILIAERIKCKSPTTITIIGGCYITDDN